MNQFFIKLEKQIYFVYLFFINFLQYLIYPKHKPTIEFLEIWVGRSCTLKCKYCFHLMPHLKNKKIFNIDEVISDLKIILESANIRHLSIGGGEPFIHPELYKVIDFAESSSSVFGGEILSNLTLPPPPSNSKILNSLKNMKKFFIRADYYKGNEINANKFIKLLDDNNIKYRLPFVEGGDLQWWLSSGLDQKEIPLSETVQNYQKCIIKNCTSLADGLLTPCCRGIISEEIYGIKDNFFENIRIRKIKFKPLLKALIRTCIQQKYYRDFCTYCLGLHNDLPKISPGKEQL